jgi:glutaredoxin 3
VPQIFIGDQHIGGCDDLYALDRRGDLDPLLGA